MPLQTSSKAIHRCWAAPALILLSGCASWSETYHSMGPCTRTGLTIGASTGALAGLALAGNPLVLGVAEGALGFYLGRQAEGTLCAPEPVPVVAELPPEEPPPEPEEEPVEPPEVVVYVPGTEAPSVDYGALTPAQLESRAATFFTGVYVTVKFDYNEAVLDEPTMQRIREVAEFVRHYPGSKVQVVGHTDGLGTESYNMNLSLQRAAGVANEFIQRGIPPNRIQVVGRGESQPLADNESEQGRAANRRVDIEVRPTDAPPARP